MNLITNVSLLGILLMNITNFSLYKAYFDLTDKGTPGLNLLFSDNRSGKMPMKPHLPDLFPQKLSFWTL